MGSALPCAPRPPTFRHACSACGRTEQRLVLTRGAHGSDGSTVVAVEAVVHVVVVRKEVEVPRAVRVARVERTRPVVAIRPNVVETAVPTVARSGQEETVTVVTSEEPTVYTVLGCPYISGIFQQFFPLVS